MKTCTKCKFPKVLTDFPENSGTSDGRGSWCRLCFQEYNRQYDRTRSRDPQYISQKKAYVEKRRKEDPEVVRVVGRRYMQRKQAWLNSLKSKPCFDCYKMFPSCCMDYDHVQGEKFKTITGLLGYRKEVILEEIAKCDLVCACCHRIRTACRRQPKAIPRSAQTFYSRVNRLKGEPCMDCGGCFPSVAMDFDHVRGEKTRGLAAMSQAPWSKVQAELEKCDLVCANCHRIRTQSRKAILRIAA